MTMEEGKGAIPNMLAIPNTDSASPYIDGCRVLAIRNEPSPVPIGGPGFFIKMLTKQGDVVLDIFAGSNTTGEAAETLGRMWLAFEVERKYLAASAFRFIEARDDGALREMFTRLMKPRELRS